MPAIQFQEQLSANLTVPASAFEFTHIPMNDSLMVFVNGVYQRLYYDYDFLNYDLLFTSSIPSGYDVRSSYFYDSSGGPIDTTELGCPAATAVRIQENLTRTVSARQFTSTYTPIENNLFVFADGVLQRNTIDYNVSNKNINFVDIVAPSTTIIADYSYLSEPDGVLPDGVQGSTTLNHVITSYELLSERIKMQLGWPIVQIEMCDDQIYDFINQAIEWYSKYAGQTEEYLIFDSSMYECGKGVQMDRLFSAYPALVCQNTSMTTTQRQSISAQFRDCDLNDYRKVAGVFSVDPTAKTGTDTLFSLDYLFAQQTYFSYMLGSFGFDLVTWHILKDWLNLREKLFATKPFVRFDPRSQYMKITPEPVGNNGWYGVIGCRVERSISDLVQERWVQRYALALTMVSLGHIRGKFGSVTLFGGGTINATDIMTMGKEDKTKLEEELMTQYGEAEPPLFFIG